MHVTQLHASHQDAEPQSSHHTIWFQFWFWLDTPSNISSRISKILILLLLTLALFTAATVVKHLKVEITLPLPSGRTVRELSSDGAV